MDPEDLILVQWKRDGKENTVAVKDIICPDGPPHPGSTIIMEWKTSKKKTEIWEGTVLHVPEEKDEGEEEESMMVDSESSEEEDDNIPLARFSAQVPSSTRNDGNSSESSKENALQSEAPSSTANDQNSSKPSQEKTLQSRAPSSAANDQSSSKPSQEKTLQSEASSSTANDQDSSKPSPEKTLHSEAPASTENDGNSLDPSQEKTLQSEPIPVCGLSSTRVGEDIPRLSENGKARKKTADPTRWKQHMRKERRSHGLPYKARDGKQHQARCVGPPCGASCKVKCSTKISVDVREELFNSYWECGSYERQRDFICQHVKPTNVTGGKIPRNKYFLPTTNGLQKVCQKFFLSTFDIKAKTVYYTLKKKAGLSFSKKDQRGKQSPKNKTPEEALDEIRSHIKSFKVIDSHYCRSSSSRQYLPTELSISKMYNMYKESSTNPQSSKIYRKVFNNEFNLGFFVPKKDECKSCTRYDNATLEEREDLQEEHQQHLHNKQRARDEKERDKARAQACQSSASFTFDLQQVLSCPSALTSVLYYKRKLSSYNLTFYNQANSDVLCFLWSEVQGNRGSCEVGSCLIHLLQALPDTVTHVTLYSDCCGGQNRNKFVSAALMYVVRTSHIKVIDQKYLESGHTQMECDSVHSAIERTKRKVAVYHPNQWSTVVTMSRQKKPYEVKQMSHEEFFDLKGLASEILPNTQRDVEGNKVQWMKLKHLRYEKASPLTIKFRYSFDDDFSELKVSASCRRMKVPKLEMLYKDMLKISSAKKSDLINLCDTLVIPRVYHSFYRDLPAHAAGSQVEDNESYVEHAEE
ncbi:uncharacterized protein [Diadema antillarum]|uniref:uncharacterized protein n=1 Tax=Diadema antillarum TaxID=105358 RepID=UPI003A8A5D29